MKRNDIRRRMTALVRRWARSGQTQAVFARRQGLTRAKLQYWVSRIDRPSDVAAPVAFRPVQVVDTAAGESGAVEVVLTTGERVVVRAGASGELVRAVVSALRPSC